MQDLDRFAELECFGLVVCAVLDPFKSWCLQSEQQLDAVKYDLALCDVGIAPQGLLLVVDCVRLAGVNIVDIASEFSEQVQRLSEA